MSSIANETILICGAIFLIARKIVDSENPQKHVFTNRRGTPKRATGPKKYVFLVQIKLFPPCKVRSGVQGEKLWILVDTEIQFQNSDVD